MSFDKSAKLSELPINKPDLISITSDQSVAAALQLCKQHDIHTLGVTDVPGDCLLGLLSTFDIMTYLAFASYPIDEDPSEIKSKKSFDTPIGDITSVFHEETQSIWDFESTSSLDKVLDTFSQGVHRAVVFDERFKILTQYDVVKFLMDKVPGLVSKNLSELGFDSCKKLVSIEEGFSALRAFRRMEMEGHTAFPVVDEAGVIVGTISASDVRHVSQDNIDLVLLPCLEFLKVVKGDLPATVTCKPNATFGEVMESLIKDHRKQTWVVDDAGKHISNVSLSDILACIHRQ